MMRTAAGLLCGLLFGIGLTIAEMVNPQKVLNFLDVGAIPSGGWDPSLALVLGGAVATTAIGYRLTFRRDRPLLDGAFSLPTRRDVDARLILGATAFGLGWGLIGFCPGPALAALGIGGPGAVVFAAAMIAGMVGHHVVFERRSVSDSSQNPAANVPS